MKNIKTRNLNYNYLKWKVKDSKDLKLKMLSYLFRTRQIEKAKLIAKYLKVGYSSSI